MALTSKTGELNPVLNPVPAKNINKPRVLKKLSDWIDELPIFAFIWSTCPIIRPNDKDNAELPIVKLKALVHILSNMLPSRADALIRKRPVIMLLLFLADVARDFFIFPFFVNA